MAKEDAEKPASEEISAPVTKKKTTRKKTTKPKASSAKKTARSTAANTKKARRTPQKAPPGAAAVEPPPAEKEEAAKAAKMTPAGVDPKAEAATAAEPAQTASEPAESVETAESKPDAKPAAAEASQPEPPPAEPVAAPPPPPARPSEPIPAFAKYAIAVLLLLVGLVVGASLLNTGKYYLVARDGAVEIWKGRFSPMGSDPLLIMPGVQPPEDIKASYDKQEVFPLAFNYYLQQAEEVLQTSDSPDFDEIKSYLNRALSFATTGKEKATVTARLKKIDRTLLIYKADVVAAGGTTENLRAARAYLKQAAALGPDAIETDLINQKLTAIEQRLKPPAPSASKETEPKPAPPAEPVKPADVEKSGSPGKTTKGKNP